MTRAEDLREAVASFFEAEILPRHRDWTAHVVRREPAP